MTTWHHVPSRGKPTAAAPERFTHNLDGEIISAQTDHVARQPIH
ncbi:hypothetical protein MCEMIE4_00111 [Sphingobium cupriresistens]